MSSDQSGRLIKQNLYGRPIFGYHPATLQPSCRGQPLQNTVAGIGLLTTTAAQSRNTAQSCGFFVRAPVFGGSFGGAQARRLSSSAVVPVVQLRSSCHPRLDSCVAVVLRRQLEPHMANTSMGASALLASDLVVEITPRWVCRFRGTRAQLIAEGLIPDDFKWPTRTQRQSWEVGDYEYSLQRCRIPGSKGPMSIWVDGDFWVLDYEPIKKPHAWQDFLIHTKRRELAEIIRCQSPEWCHQSFRAQAAKQDGKYMNFMNQLTGGLKPSRTRATKKTSTHITQGAAA